MNPTKCKYVVYSLAAGGLLLAGLFLLLDRPAETANAASMRFFVTSGGGGDCSQGDPCDLKTAIGAATHGDTIFVAAGTYTGDGTAVVTVTHSITLYGGWDGALTGAAERNPAAHVTILDGERARRVVYIGEGITPTVDGFTITGGNATGLTENCLFYPDGCGGGVYAYNAHPVIVNNVITHNVAAITTGGSAPHTTGFGGGLYLLDTDRAVISSNVIISNVGSMVYNGAGGGLFMFGSGANMKVQANQVLSNVASMANTCFAGGGGIYDGVEGPGGLIQGNLVQGNRANAFGWASGAGLKQHQGETEYRGNMVTGNQGYDAVLLEHSHSRFEGNWIVDNDCDRGVRVSCGPGGPTLVNNVVARSGEHSLSARGLVDERVEQPLTVTLLHNTLVGDGSGEGIHVETGYVTLSLTNNIVASHTWGITNAYPASSTVAADHTLFWGNTNDGIRGTNPVEGDPRFVSPDGGDYHIGPGSEAIDEGVDSGVTTDKDGVPRPQGSAPDLGAYEFHEFTLEVTIVGEGTVTREPVQGIYHYGDVVTLTATPDPGWAFAGWGGDIGTSENPLVLVVEADTAVTAIFGKFYLDVTTIGEGNVAVDPEQPIYNPGDVVTLAATADLGWAFTGWSGDVESKENPLSLAMDADKAVTATFLLKTYVITPTVGVGGVITPSTPQTVSHGDDITFAIAANAGYHIADVVVDEISRGSVSSYTFKGVTADHTISATFALSVAPEITSADHTTLFAGETGTFTVTATGAPTPMVLLSGALPFGVILTDNGDGTANLSGTPAVGSAGQYILTFTASNGVAPDATQTFTLTVNTRVYLPLVLVGY